MVLESAASEVAENPQPQAAVRPATPEFKRNFFLNLPDSTGATQPAPEKKWWKRGKEETPTEESPFVRFSDQARKEMATFLDNFVTNTHASYNREDGREILKSQPHAEEIMKLLGANENAIDNTTLSANIDKMLNTPQGWVYAKTLLDQQTALHVFTLGLMTNAELGKKGINPQDLISPADIDDTGIGKIRRKVIGNHSKGETAAVGGALGGLAGYDITKLAETGVVGDAARFLANNFPTDKASLMGMVTGAGGAILGWHLGGGEDIKDPGFAVAKEALLSIQKDKEYARYIEAVIGVDVNDFIIDTSTQTIKVVNRPKSTNNLSSVLEGARSNLETRKHYFDALGVPPEDRDIMPEQFIMAGEQAGFERTGERVNAEILRKYNELGGRTTGNKDLSIFREARELVLADLTEDLVRKIGENPTRSVTVIDQKIKDRTEDEGRIIQERREKAKKDVPELQSLLDESFHPRVEALDSYAEAQKSLEDVRKTLPRYIMDTFGSEVTEVGEALQKIREIRRGSGGPLSITIEGEEASIENIEQRRRKARNDYNEKSTELLRENPREGDEPLELWKQRLKTLGESPRETLNAELAEIKVDSDTLDNIESKIKELQGAIRENEEALDPRGEVAIARHGVLYARQIDREKAWQLVDNTDVHDLLLSNSPSDILQKINELHKSDPDFGWEEADNEDPMRDQILAYAMTAARAMEGDGDTIRAFRDDPNISELTNVATFEEIENLSVEELKNRLGDTLDEDQITLTKESVTEFAKRMTRATKDVQEDLGLRIRRAERLAEAVDLGAEIEHLEVTKDAMARQGAVFGLASEVVTNATEHFPLKGNRLQNFSELSGEAKKGYTKAEQDLAGDQPVAYYEFLNVLFDYQGKSDTEARFQKISKTVSPDVLSEILQDVAVEPFKGADLNEILFKLQDNIKKGLVSRRAVRKMFEGVIGDLEARALALP